MLITLPAEIEEQISSRARAEGLAPSDYVERLLLEDEECRILFDRMVGEECSGLRSKPGHLRRGSPSVEDQG